MKNETVKEFIERFIPESGYIAGAEVAVIVRVGDALPIKGNRAEVLEKLASLDYEPTYCDSKISGFALIEVSGV